jgi:hypothetical protein
MRFEHRLLDRVGKIIQDSGDPSGSRFNLRLAVPFDLVTLRAAQEPLTSRPGASG